MSTGKKPPVLFTCEHCGEVVRAAMFEGLPKPRNHCPSCLWSKHVAMGENVGYPPCGAMIRGVDVGNEEVVWRCLGCGFMMRHYTDDYLFRTLGSLLVREASGTVWRCMQPSLYHN